MWLGGIAEDIFGVVGGFDGCAEFVEFGSWKRLVDGVGVWDEKFATHLMRCHVPVFLPRIGLAPSPGGDFRLRLTLWEGFALLRLVFRAMLIGIESRSGLVGSGPGAGGLWKTLLEGSL